MMRRNIEGGSETDQGDCVDKVEVRERRQRRITKSSVNYQTMTEGGIESQWQHFVEVISPKCCRHEWSVSHRQKWERGVVYLFFDFFFKRVSASTSLISSVPKPAAAATSA
jgi:hypothetical protein